MQMFLKKCHENCVIEIFRKNNECPKWLLIGIRLVIKFCQFLAIGSLNFKTFFIFKVNFGRYKVFFYFGATKCSQIGCNWAHSFGYN